MARFALLLPREEMVEPAGRIARELEMDVVLNQSVPTERILDLMEDCRRAGADILVARGRQASILKEHTDFPVVEIQLTGLEIARLLHRARSLVSHLERPKIGVVTIPNMVGNIQGFEEIFDIELHTYFISGLSEMERGAEQAVADGMDVILGGDFVNAYCRRLGKRTLFFDGTEDSLRTSLLHARNVGQVADAERRNTAHLQVLLDYSFNGILELDARGIIVQSNDVACKILEQEREKLVGLPLSTLMPREDAEFWADALAQRRELYFSVLNVAGVHVVANAAPVADWDAGEGMVFSFYEMQKMERQGERALRERYRLQRYLAHGRFEDVNHTSREMSRLVKLARTFAETGQPILVYGEVGSGKSLFAQSIHNASPCSKGPFVTFDCAAHSPEQEAALSRAGKAADTGTLYLDNLDQLTPGGQRVLCRLLREGVVHVQGEDTPTPVAARVIGSLTGDLAPKLEAGVFQPELYYLLTPLRLSLPPLRTRPDDLNQAIDMCLDDCVVKFNRYVVLTREARRLLMDYPWPGNYIQLRAFLERMVLTPLRLSLPPLRTRPDDLNQAIDMCLDDCVVKFNRYVVLTREARRLLMDYPWPGNYIQLRAFLERMVLTAPARTVNDGYVRSLLEELYPLPVVRAQGQALPTAVSPEAARLAEVLSRNGGSRAAAAAELGISKTTLWRRMKQYGIRDRFEG